MSRRLPSANAMNVELSVDEAVDVYLLHTVEVAHGQRVRLVFESSNSDWRQGVWIGTSGSLRAGRESDQFVFWMDESSEPIDIEVVATDGLLRVYNVWDAGTNNGYHESLAATSGMLVSRLDGGGFGYACNDFGFNPVFDKIKFRLETL